MVRENQNSATATVAPGLTGTRLLPSPTRVPAPAPGTAQAMPSLVRQAAERVFSGAGSLTTGSITLQQLTVADIRGEDHLAEVYSADFPIWVATAVGSFVPPFSPSGSTAVFARATAYFDPSGKEIGLTLTDELKGTQP